jgi:hypothetical protein
VNFRNGWVGIRFFTVRFVGGHQNQTAEQTFAGTGRELRRQVELPGELVLGQPAEPVEFPRRKVRLQFRAGGPGGKGAFGGRQSSGLRRRRKFTPVLHAPIGSKNSPDG